MGRVRLHRWPALAALLLAMAACSPLGLGPGVPPEDPPTEAVAGPEISERSRLLGTFYARLERDLLARGLLRQDGGGVDTPFSEVDLERNFIRIALFDEYTREGDQLLPRARESRLRRWDSPITMSVVAGERVSAEQAATDLAMVRDFTGRLSELSGLPIRLTDANPNFHVLVLTEDDRLEAGPLLREIAPGISEDAVRAIVTMPRSTLCLVLAFSEPASPYTYTRAIAVVRAEHPDLLRLSCFHEELAQGLGLANDHPAARPSIFNDDEEFALLTEHDALLLRMLYDPRLDTGMTAAEVAPIAREIAAGLLAGPS